MVAQATTLVARSPITLDISVAGHARSRLLSELRAKVFATGPLQPVLAVIVRWNSEVVSLEKLFLVWTGLHRLVCDQFFPRLL